MELNIPSTSSSPKRPAEVTLNSIYNKLSLIEQQIAEIKHMCEDISKRFEIRSANTKESVKPKIDKPKLPQDIVDNVISGATIDLHSSDTFSNRLIAKLPIRTIEEMNYLELQLNSDFIQKRLIEILLNKVQHTNTPKEAIEIGFKELFADNLSINFNWSKNWKEKVAIKSLKIINILKMSVKKLHSNLEDEEFKEYIQYLLKLIAFQHALYIKYQ